MDSTYNDKEEDISWSAAMWASGPAAAARPVEAGLGPARDGWPPTSALALLVKMAAVAIAATKVQAYSAQAPVVFRLLSHFAHAHAARPASLREGMCLPRFEPAAKSCSLEARATLPPRPQLLSSPENWCLICCLPADAAGEPGGPLYYKEVLTRFYLEFFYPHDSGNANVTGPSGPSATKERSPETARAAEPASGLASLSFRHSWHPMGRPEYRPLASQPAPL